MGWAEPGWTQLQKGISSLLAFQSREVCVCTLWLTPAAHFTHAVLAADHVVPQSKGGENTWENLVACCGAPVLGF